MSRDGSFPRITSSLKGIGKCMKIVEVPEEEREASGLHYKLVWIGPDESEESDKSDEDLWSEDEKEEGIPNVQLPVGHAEESNGTNSKDQTFKNDMKRPTNRNKHRSNQSNYNSLERNFNSNKLHNYNSIGNKLNTEEDYYNPINRNSFGATSSGNYNPSVANPSDIPTWIAPTQVEFTTPRFQYPHNQFGIFNSYVPPVEHIGLTPPNSSFSGILGYSPYDQGHSPYDQVHSPYDHTLNFSQNRQNDSFRYDANSWNNTEYRHSDSYRGPGHGQTSFQERRTWNKTRKAHNYWDKNRNQERSHPPQRGNQKRNHPPQRGHRGRDHPSQRKIQGRNHPSHRGNRDGNYPLQRGNQDRNCLFQSGNQDRNCPLPVVRRQDLKNNP